MNIRQTRKSDITALQAVLDATDLFPAQMLPELISGFLANDDPEDIWLTCEQNGQAIGFCYAVPEQMADGAWNMLAVAVRPDEQSRGCGAALTVALEKHLTTRGQRILIADTSGTLAFARTRAFYLANGYSQEARIRDFWAPGDDKIVFWKALW